MVRKTLVAAAVWLAGCGSDDGSNSGDGGSDTALSISRDGVELCIGAAITATDVVGVNRIDIESRTCATPFASTFFEMFETDTLPCTDFRVEGQGCTGLAMPSGSLIRAGTTAAGSCTCDYEEVVVGGPNVPHLIELEFDVTLEPL